MEMTVKTNDWVDYYTPLTKPELRVFCIPFAGGGASKYSPWKRIVPEGVEIVPIQLPGREKRVREKLEYDLIAMAEKIASAIAEISSDGIPFIIFGHSMGGILAFETTKILEKNGILPRKCVISATDLEGISNLRSVRDMTDEELLDAVSVYGAAQDLEAMKKFKFFFGMFMRVIRADFIMLEDYAMDTSSKITVPITALYSDCDKLARRKTMEFWKNMTDAKFAIREFKGNHFYLFENESAVIDAIIND